MKSYQPFGSELADFLALFIYYSISFAILLWFLHVNSQLILAYVKMAMALLLWLCYCLKTKGKNSWFSILWVIIYNFVIFLLEGLKIVRDYSYILFLVISLKGVFFKASYHFIQNFKCIVWSSFIISPNDVFIIRGLSGYVWLFIPVLFSVGVCFFILHKKTHCQLGLLVHLKLTKNAF